MFQRKSSVIAGSFLIAAFLVGPAYLAEESKDPKTAKKQGKTADKSTDKSTRPKNASPSVYDAASRGSASSAEVITNEDLEKMMESLTPEERQSGVYQADRPRSTTAAPDEEASEEGTKPGKAKTTAAEQEGATKARKSGDVQQAEQKVTDLQTRIAELEKAILATKNPLLPREWTRPKGDEAAGADQQQNLESLDNVGRLQYREDQLRQAREELAAARQELARRRGGGSDDEP